jgi:hypothetical protein
MLGKPVVKAESPHSLELHVASTTLTAVKYRGNIGLTYVCDNGLFSTLEILPASYIQLNQALWLTVMKIRFLNVGNLNNVFFWYRRADYATPRGTNCSDKQLSPGGYSSFADSGHEVCMYVKR